MPAAWSGTVPCPVAGAKVLCCMQLPPSAPACDPIPSSTVFWPRHPQSGQTRQQQQQQQEAAKPVAWLTEPPLSASSPASQVLPSTVGSFGPTQPHRALLFGQSEYHFKGKRQAQSSRWSPVVPARVQTAACLPACQGSSIQYLAWPICHWEAWSRHTILTKMM